jgi:hypothetical protein
MDDIEISAIETVGVAKDGVVMCRAMFQFDGAPHGPLAYSLRPLRGYPRFEVVFDKSPATP